MTDPELAQLRAEEERLVRLRPTQGQGKGEQFAPDHPDQVEKVSHEAIQRGGDAVDQATGDKYQKNVDQVQEKADARIGDDS